MTENFRRLDESGRSWVTIKIDGQSERALAGESVAAAVLAAGLRSCRTTPVSGTARAPYCMMGVCFDCLMEIDGESNRQSCQISVREGMEVCRQTGAGET